MSAMDDRLWKEQLGDILEASERKELLDKYTEAIESFDFERAHEALLELTLRLLERSSKIIKDMNAEQESNRLVIERLEGRLTELLRKY